jgi:hypothetical protein
MFEFEMKRKKERKQGEQVDEGNYCMVVHMVDWCGSCC